MSTCDDIARLEEQNRQLRWENNKLDRERQITENERIRMEYAAERICAAEAAAAERERKNNIREKLVQEAKLIGKVHGLAALSKLFNQVNQIGQSNTTVQSVKAAPKTQALPQAEVPFDKMTAWEKGRFVKNLVKQGLESQEIK